MHGLKLNRYATNMSKGSLRASYNIIVLLRYAYCVDLTMSHKYKTGHRSLADLRAGLYTNKLERFYFM